MKDYRVYQELPIVDSQETKKVYLKDNGDFTEDKTEGKLFRVLNIIQLILKLLYEFGLFNNLKIERK